MRVDAPASIGQRRPEKPQLLARLPGPRNEWRPGADRCQGGLEGRVGTCGYGQCMAHGKFKCEGGEFVVVVVLGTCHLPCPYSLRCWVVGTWDLGDDGGQWESGQWTVDSRIRSRQWTVPTPAVPRQWTVPTVWSCDGITHGLRTSFSQDGVRLTVSKRRYGPISLREDALKTTSILLLSQRNNSV